ncbi:MAG: hypothetical protein ABFC84_12040 [Veillonellales bacterium]
MIGIGCSVNHYGFLFKASGYSLAFNFYLIFHIPAAEGIGFFYAGPWLYIQAGYALFALAANREYSMYVEVVEQEK